MLAKAKEFGIDLEGLTWAEQNRIVKEALEAKGYIINKEGVIIGEPDMVEEAKGTELDEALAEIERLKAELASKMTDVDEKCQPEEKDINVKEKCQPEEKELKIPKGRVFMAPEIRGTGVQLLKYDEVLGDDVNVEEISYKNDFNNMRVERDLTMGTYKIKGKTGRKVIAQSTVPKENAGVSYDPNTDIVPVITYNGISGYIWTHQHYPNIKELLMATGMLPKYQELFDSSKHPENIWMAAGKMWVVSIPMVHYVFAEIEREMANNAG